MEVLLTMFALLCAAFIQNISFTMVSRARNRDNAWYHAICSVFSNGLWFLTIGIIIRSQMEGFDFTIAVPYIIGTVSGSLVGAKISIFIEKSFGMKT